MSSDHQGQCLFCNQTNSYSALTCSNCHTRLPWANALMQSRQPMAAPDTSLQPTQWAQPQSPAPLQRNHLAGPAQQRYCAHCGTEHLIGASYCSSCGTSVANLAAAQQNTPGARDALLSAFAQRMAMSPNASSVNHSVLSPQQTVNVSVVTQQKSGSGWWSRFVLFLFKVALFLTLASGILEFLRHGW